MAIRRGALALSMPEPGCRAAWLPAPPPLAMLAADPPRAPPLLVPLLLTLDDRTLSSELLSLLVIALIAAGTPLLVGLLQLRVAEVVLLLAAGVLCGPHGLHWIVVDDAIQLLSQLGLGFLFFAAGLELEQEAIRGRPGRVALIGWLASAAAALLAAWMLQRSGMTADVIGIAVALTSTALGTLLPILRDRGELHSRFGLYFMGAGAIGEFGPILATSLLLGASNTAIALLSLLMFAAVAWIVASVPRHLLSERLVQVVRRGRHSSSQTGVRLCLLLLVALLVIANRFGLDVVLGAFVAGVILRRSLPPEQETLLSLKVEGLAFGIFVPIFFIVSGATLDIASILQNPHRLLIFFVLLLLVRGLPQWFLYRQAIPDPRQRGRFALLVATGLPLIVAVTTVETSAGLMRPENAAALVGAGALSVLVFPLLAAALAGKAEPPGEAA
ncbi:MAG: cation:proton antiporter [Synechococcaceae cyanobacterium]|nr:cation:proton antiporter [Synechococcaceae cyanobacterium]